MPQGCAVQLVGSWRWGQKGLAPDSPGAGFTAAHHGRHWLSRGECSQPGKGTGHHHMAQIPGEQRSHKIAVPAQEWMGQTSAG